MVLQDLPWVDVFRSVASRYGFLEIQTPVFEFTELFARTLGETSDVVSKEMYSFDDRNNESLTLRPEYTAGIARAYLSEGMQQHGVSKLYGWGPMFRYERPQKGRYRQFAQLDAEIIGAAEPDADIELIALGYQVLLELGLGQKVKLELNTLGDMESRTAYRTALVKYFTDHKRAARMSTFSPEISTGGFRREKTRPTLQRTNTMSGSTKWSRRRASA